MSGVPNNILIFKNMKKLSLEMLRLTSDEVLGRSQMKKITGGYGGGSGDCSWNICNAGTTCCEPATNWCDGPSGYCKKR